MAKIYAKKILNHEINPATEKEWCLDDVPTRWYEEVKEMIENEAE